MLSNIQKEGNPNGGKDFSPPSQYLSLSHTQTYTLPTFFCLLSSFLFPYLMYFCHFSTPLSFISCVISGSQVFIIPIPLSIYLHLSPSLSLYFTLNLDPFFISLSLAVSSPFLSSPPFVHPTVHMFLPPSLSPLSLCSSLSPSFPYLSSPLFLYLPFLSLPFPPFSPPTLSPSSALPPSISSESILPADLILNSSRFMAFCHPSHL